MLAFDFYINGKKVCRAGIKGPGVLATHVDLVRGVASGKRRKASEDLSLHVGGLDRLTGAHVKWLHRELQLGDTIRIDIVEAAKVDRPQKVKSETQRSRTKREQDFVTKKAATWGWRIEK